MEPVHVGIVTISDRCHAGISEDKSGKTIETSIESQIFGDNFKVVKKTCIPDEESDIKNILIQWSDEYKLDIILTTGGTGLSHRDVTPEATKSIIDREVPGISIAITQQSLKITPMAMLSRLVCGTRKRTLIVNFPGSVNACVTCLEVLKPVVKHAVDLLRNKRDNIAKVHNLLKLQSKVSTEFIAKRNRKSPFELITAEDAQTIILNLISPLPMLLIDNKKALGYCLQSDILAPENFPPVPTSIKDGYALIANDGKGRRTVIHSLVAGDDSAGFNLKAGQCIRITTGAPIPHGADAVVQVEDTNLLKDTDDGRTELEIEILEEPKVGLDIRPIGSDIKINSLLVKAGNFLTPFDLALLASAGINNIAVTRKPIIAVLSTGNELQNPNEKLKPGKIRDSNRIMLLKLLERNGYEAVDCGIVIDEPNEILTQIRNALTSADILISTGGVSMGEKDLLADVLLQDLDAQIHFGRINMKPGKPTKFFSVPIAQEKKFVFALPGNPVSAAVTFHLFVLPALARMSGVNEPLPKLIKVKVNDKITLTERAEFARASMIWDENGVVNAKITGNQISSRLISMVNGECLLHLPSANETIKFLPAGTLVNAQII